MNELQDLIDNNARWADAINQEDPEFFAKLARFSRYYRKAHNGFLRLAVRHLYRAPLRERRGV